MSHTPTPWKTNGYEGKLAKAVHSIDSKVLICAVEQPLLSSIQPDSQTAHDNAEFIVRACNAHNELVSVLRLIRNNRDHNAQLGRYMNGTLGDNQCFDDWAADIASAAIAKATS